IMAITINGRSHAIGCVPAEDELPGLRLFLGALYVGTTAVPDAGRRDKRARRQTITRTNWQDASHEFILLTAVNDTNPKRQRAHGGAPSLALRVRMERAIFSLLSDAVQS